MVGEGWWYIQAKFPLYRLEIQQSTFKIFIEMKKANKHKIEKNGDKKQNIKFVAYC